MPQHPLSVVLTVYNMGECLRDCMDSLEAQTYQDFELICIDDGSTDESDQILAQYEGSFESFLVVQQQNQGAAAARNVGIDQARGDYLIMLDSDDIFDPSFLETMMDKAAETKADVVVCRSNEFNHRTRVWHSPTWVVRDNLLPEKPVFAGVELGGNVFQAFAGWPWDKLFRLDFIRDNNLRYPLLRNSEDLVFVYTALAKAQRIAVLRQALVHHRTNRSGSVSTTQPSHPDDFYKAIVLLKNAVRKLPTYGQLEQGFLNWAVDFALWNIESLPVGETRAKIVGELFAGGFPELELESHPMSYFSHYPRTAKRYELLKTEAQGGAMATRRSFRNIAAALWDYVTTLNVSATLADRKTNRRS